MSSENFQQNQRIPMEIHKIDDFLFSQKVLKFVKISDFPYENQLIQLDSEFRNIPKTRKKNKF